MNSAFKPALSATGPQNASGSAQLNKPMHPQGAPATYGQPTAHVPQGLVNLPHGNPATAHSHPNPAHQTNHYSLNVPNASQHYSTNNPATIPSSNHPVANVSQAAAGGQTYTTPKAAPYSGGYQPNLGHPPNQNPMPPVSQTLPATQTPQGEAPNKDKPQSNGTPEIKTPLVNKSQESQDNHVTPKDKSNSPLTGGQQQPPLAADKTEKKSATVAPPVTSHTVQPTPVPDQMPPKPADSSTTINKVQEQVTPSTVASVPASVTAPPPPSTVSTTSSLKQEPHAPPVTAENSDTSNGDVKVKGDLKGDTGSLQKDDEDLDETSSDESDSGTSTHKDDVKDEKASPAAKASTPRTPTRKSKTPKAEADSPKTYKAESKTPPTQKSPSTFGKSKRTRTRTQPYQSPLPEIEIITKISSSTPKPKNSDEKLIVFYKNEFLAVRNSEGGFYICQAVQNIYRSSAKIRIRWLSQEKNAEIYTPDFYDHTEFDCILTNLDLDRVEKGKYRLPPAEKERTDSILKRSIAVEKGEVTSPSLTEEHPDGIDLSLYKEESQLKKRKGTKRKAASALKYKKSGEDDDAKSPDTPKTRKVLRPGRKPKKASPASKKAAAASPPTAPTSETRKQPTAAARSDRAKRRTDNQNHNNKVKPPVVDLKKAKVLGKIARKAVATVTAPPGSSTSKTTPIKNAKGGAKGPGRKPAAAKAGPGRKGKRTKK